MTTTDIAISPVIYEVGNFLLWTIGVMVLPCFAYVMFILTREHVKALAVRGARGWVTAAVDLTRHDLAYRASIALIVYVTGSVVKDGWAWLALYLANTNGRDLWMLTQPWVYFPIAGISLAIIGKLCMIRVFTSPEWGRAAYMGAGAVSGLAALALWLLR